MPSPRERQQAAERRALVRTCILRTAKNAAPYAVSLQIIEVGLGTDGLHLGLDEILGELQYLVDTSWIVETHATHTPAARRWRITKAGIDQVEMEGF
jgi:hypothetical protein